jgi:hypothetical protein
MADVDLGQKLGFGGRMSDLVGVFRPMGLILAPNPLVFGSLANTSFDAPLMPDQNSNRC